MKTCLDCFSHLSRPERRASATPGDTGWECNTCGTCLDDDKKILSRGNWLSPKSPAELEARTLEILGPDLSSLSPLQIMSLDWTKLRG